MPLRTGLCAAIAVLLAAGSASAGSKPVVTPL
jgi:hypothetical protein